MENPLKMRRLRANRTQDEIAELAGVTHDNVIRNEQGLFNNPSPRVLQVILDLSGDEKEQVLKEWKAWIAHHRRNPKTKHALQRMISFGKPQQLKEHPFLLWRTAVFPGTSRIEFCKILALHPATVLKYETANQRPMPSQIYEALKEAGMPVDRIEALAKIGSEYFAYERQRRAASAAAQAAAQAVNS